MQLQMSSLFIRQDVMMHDLASFECLSIFLFAVAMGAQIEPDLQVP